MRKLLTGFVVAAALLTAGHSYGQGSLTPTGAPAPIFKTLEQLEPRTPIGTIPFTISESGSYYLTGNLVATGGFTGDGITINADNVTIDMYGFSLVGVSGSMSGIAASGARRNISIDNGVVKLWDASGINLRSATNSKVTRIRFSDNNYALRGGGATIVNKCTATAQTSLGIEVAQGSEINGCIVDSTSAGPGFLLQDGSLIIECVAYSNAHSGIVASNSCSVADCASGRNQHGFQLHASQITGCAATHNTSNGITLLSRCKVKRNIARFNDGASIEVQGGGNCIEENLLNDTLGLNVLASNNLIIANAVATNNSIATGNRVGPLDYNVNSPPTNHPWANIGF